MVTVQNGSLVGEVGDIVEDWKIVNGVAVPKTQAELTTSALSRLKEQALEQIKGEYVTAYTAGHICPTSGVMMDVYPGASGKLNGAITLAKLQGAASVTVTLFDNSRSTMPLADVEMLNVEQATEEARLYALFADARAAIYAAPDAAAVSSAAQVAW